MKHLKQFILLTLFAFPAATASQMEQRFLEHPWIQYPAGFKTKAQNLYNAIEANNLDRVKAILKDYPREHINAAFEDLGLIEPGSTMPPATALTLAYGRVYVSDGSPTDYPILKELLAHGANINELRTYLDQAAAGGHEAQVRWLLENGLRDKNGEALNAARLSLTHLEKTDKDNPLIQKWREIIRLLEQYKGR